MLLKDIENKNAYSVRQRNWPASVDLMRGFQRYVPFVRKNSVAYVKKLTLSVSVSLPLPSFRSYRIAFYFLRCRSRKPELRPLGCAGNSPASPLGLPGHSPIWRKRQRRLRNGSTDTGFTETVTETDTDELNTGNKALFRRT